MNYIETFARAIDAETPPMKKISGVLAACQKKVPLPKNFVLRIAYDKGVYFFPSEIKQKLMDYLADIEKSGFLNGEIAEKIKQL